jgi:hypothetical protein
MKRPPLTEDIQHDMSQFYPLKDVLEQLFGKATYDRVKETAGLREWKAETTKLLKAIEIAISATVQVADDAWRDEIRDILKLGRRHIATSRSVTALFAHLSATLTRLVFIQIGFLPLGHYRDRVVPLTAKRWKLDPVRTVQYVQSADQRATAQCLHQRRKTAGAKLSADE